MPRASLTAERLREVLDYDPESGLFRWKIRTSNRVKAGDVAGIKRHVLGYLFIMVDNEKFKAHRLVWFYMHGMWPQGDIDHLNGVRWDNRISNLRDVSRGVNLENQRKAHSNNRSSGLLGVSLCKRSGLWRANIRAQGKSRQIGRYKTAELAHAAYLEEKRKLHEGCTI